MLSNPKPHNALLLAILVVSCDSGFPSRDEPPPARAGAEPGHAVASDAPFVRTAHYELWVSAFQECSVSAPESLDENTRRVGVEVSLTPLGELQVPANPYYALLIDREGNVYEATLGGCGTPLSPSLPEPRQIARGWITFDLPEDARELELSYAPELLGGPKEEVSLQLRL